MSYGCGSRFSAFARCIAAAAVLAASQAGAAPAERDKAWNALIAAAKARGAEETKLDRSASFVFQSSDGVYVTFTRLLATDKGRSVCLIAKEETATACVDWDNGRLKVGKRNDAASPWRFYDFESLDALQAAQPTLLDKFSIAAWNFFKHFGSPAGSFGDQCMYLSSNGLWRHADKSNCD